MLRARFAEMPDGQESNSGRDHAGATVLQAILTWVVAGLRLAVLGLTKRRRTRVLRSRTVSSCLFVDALHALVTQLLAEHGLGRSLREKWPFFLCKPLYRIDLYESKCCILYPCK